MNDSTVELNQVTLINILNRIYNDNFISKKYQQDYQKPQLNQFSQIEGNQLEIITYIEGRGKINGSLGASVAGIGDINLDGYDDVIVGKPGKGAGEALIFWGGIEMDSIPDIILHGENEGDGFGSNVSSKCDINGDFYSDFIITAPGHPNRKGKGRIYIYFGSANFDTIPDMIVDGEQQYSNLGMHLAIGDVNGD